MNYVFDIDGTICESPLTDYEKAVPIKERICYINELYDAGNNVTYMTARGMGRHNGDRDKACNQFYEFTKAQLNSWGAKHHRLLLGKPAADIYVDDKGMLDTDFFSNIKKPKSSSRFLPRKTNLEMQHVEKGWGWERWICNGPEYCGKLLFFNKGKKCSWHRHVLKDEVFYLQSGKMLVKYSDTDDINQAHELILNPGDNFHVYRGLRHRMIALEDSELFEFSTQHFDTDSYRIIKGD